MLSNKLTIKSQIVQFLTGKPQATLKEIYLGLNADGITKHNIRAVLNINVKKDQTFERISKATYKLKEVRLI